MSAVKIEEQIHRLRLAVETFAASVLTLSEESFLAKLNSWSPRDIVAHLIGWNRHVIKGSKQIQRRELPFYDLDPGENYSKVNAALVQHYDSTDKQLLLEQLQASALELKEFLKSLDEERWARDFGVRNGGAEVTIRSTVDELIDDYDHHRRQIEASAPGPFPTWPGPRNR